MSRSIQSMMLFVGICMVILIATRAAGAEDPGTLELEHVASPLASLGDTTLGDTTVELDAACGKCGDGFCSRSCGETPTSCPPDCGTVELDAACGKCGDGFCSRSCGETATSCPPDCGVTETAEINGPSPN